MRFGKAEIFASAGFLLAIGIVVASYFLFYNKKRKTPLEAAQETNIETSISGNSKNETAAEVEDDSLITDEPIDYPEPLETKEITSKEVKLNDSIWITPKRIVPVGQEECEFEYFWEEIRYKNLKVSAEINKRIKTFVNENLEACLGEEQPCNGCDLAGKVYYISPEMIGVALFASEPTFRRIQHHQTIFYLDPASGKEIRFRDLLKPERAAQFDSLLIAKLKKQYELSSEERYREQLPDLSFYVEPTEISFTFYNEVGNWVMDVNLKSEEIRPLLKTPFAKAFIR